MAKITYKSSGVDVEEGNKFTKKLKMIAKKTSRKNVISSIGGFGGLYDLSKLKIKNPILVTSADGVGTKVMIAMEMEEYSSVGIDLVAMNVNDILTLGARPLVFLDYLAVGKLNIKNGAQIVSGVAQGCKLSGCSLIGGETAEMPDIYDKNDFDLAGFCVGVMDREKVIDGSEISEGDVVIGLTSSGFHSNGYSLVRKVIKEANLDLFKKYKGFRKTLGDILLEPTKIYVKPVLELLKTEYVKGMAHITGGSFRDKLSRIIPDGLCANINRNFWRLPEIFKFIKDAGEIEDEELYSTFNCGIGYILVVGSNEVRNVLDHFGPEAIEIGYIEKTEGLKVNLI